MMTMSSGMFQELLAQHERWLKLGRKRLLSFSTFLTTEVPPQHSTESARRLSLNHANLCALSAPYANLAESHIFASDLSHANLSYANLSRAYLERTDFTCTKLEGASLVGASLRKAKLEGAELFGANLFHARLENTCLDPLNKPNGDVKGFQRCGGYVLGYRTRQAGHVDEYEDGRWYNADWFSTSANDCHPGLYLWPLKALAHEWAIDREVIAVYSRPEDVHKAGLKWRTKAFLVLGSA